VDRCVGHLDQMMPGIDPTAFLRSFDPYTLQLRFRGDSLDLEAMAQEVVRIWQLLEKPLRPSSGGPLVTG
jgi:hypothetical protein